MLSGKDQLLLLISTPFYIIVIGIEVFLSNAKARAAYTVKDTLQNLYLNVLNASLDLGFRAVYIGIILTYFYNHRIFPGISNPWIYWVAIIIFEDFMYYWLHRVDHHVRLFWATHVTHHSSERFNFTVGIRSSVMEPLYRFVYFIPLALCGFTPIDIAFAYSATQTWGIIVHTERIKKMGWLEYILVTPSHHRVHHGSNPKYLDKNLGMLLLIWDKIFGTFQRELPATEYQPIKYGLTTPIGKETPINLVFHEWNSLRKDLKKQGLSARDRWKYLFGPPGWSHDGSRLTSDQLRKLENENKL